MKNYRFDPDKWNKNLNDKYEKLNQRTSKKFGVPIELIRVYTDFLIYKTYLNILSK